MAKRLKKTKVRKVERNNLPFGKFKYEVNFNVNMFHFYSTRYHLAESNGKLIKFKSKQQRRRALVRANVSIYSNSFRRTNHALTLNIDEFVDSFEGTIIGKHRIGFNIRDKLPLKLYLTDYEDLTLLYFNYRKYIGRIFEIITK